jgi:hypothetical protein
MPEGQDELMKPAQTSTMNLVILVLGAALVVFFAGVSAVLAVTGSAPAEMWAAGAAISGALVGLLVPPPRRQAAAQVGATTTAEELGDNALQAAQRIADRKEGSDKDAARQAVQRLEDVTERAQTSGFMQAVNVDPDKAPEVAATSMIDVFGALETGAPQGSTEAEVYGAATDAADQNKGSAQDKGKAAVDAAGGTGKLPALVKVLLGLFGGLLAIGIGMSFIPSEGDQLVREADKTILALASSSGGALIGVLAPPKSSGRTS